MGTRDIYQKVLVRACLAAGGETALARSLGVPAASVARWLLGHGRMPMAVFARAVEIALQQTRPEHEVSERGFALAFIESQSGILERLSRGAPLASVLALLVRAMEALSEGMLGSVLLLSPDGRATHGAAPGLPAAYVNAIEGLKIGPTAGSCGSAMYFGKTVIVSDIASDPLWRAYRRHALKHGLRACWSAPIVSPGGEILGAFAFYYREPREPSPRERRVVEVAAELAAIAITRAMAQAPGPAAAPERAALSARELEIVRLIANGEPVKRIARDLGLTISTVYTHRARIFDKLGVRSNARLARYAMTRRLVR
jgi:DNA-binding CsgD family transcriptional regulator